MRRCSSIFSLSAIAQIRTFLNCFLERDLGEVPDRPQVKMGDGPSFQKADWAQYVTVT